MSCQNCDPKLNPQRPRENSLHFAIRFHDYSRTVKKHGVQIFDCTEVDLRRDLAYRYDLPNLCDDCGAGPAMYIDYGGFQVGGSK